MIKMTIEPYYQLGNKEKKQLQLDVHFGISNPMKEKIKMANLKEEAQNYEVKNFKGIEECEKIPVDVEIFDGEGTTKEGETFKYKYMKQDDGTEIRVPASVLIQLKAHLEANQDLKFVSVMKSGSGLNTAYTVVPAN